MRTAARETAVQITEKLLRGGEGRSQEIQEFCSKEQVIRRSEDY